MGRRLNLSLFLCRAQKPYLVSYSIYKHDAIDLADPSSMQNACYMNFIIDLAHCRVSVAQWFDSSWGLRIFSLSHARDMTKNSILC